MKNIIDTIKTFISNERKNKKSNIFWIPFILLVVLCLTLFVIYRISITGWLLAIILFFAAFVLRYKIFIYSFYIQIIIVIIFLGLISTVFVFTKTKDENKVVDNVSKEPLREITFNKTYDLEKSMGTYELKLLTNKDKNRYELELYVYALTSIIPSDFILDNQKAESYVREGITVYKLDQLEVFITSKDKSVEYYSHGPVSLNIDYSTGSPKVNSMFPTRFTMYFNSEKSLKTFMDKYNKLEVYRYNIGEVGLRDFKSEKRTDGSYMGSYGYNSEKAYKLHPILLETSINWDGMKTETGL